MNFFETDATDKTIPVRSGVMVYKQIWEYRLTEIMIKHMVSFLNDLGLFKTRRQVIKLFLFKNARTCFKKLHLDSFAIIALGSS